MTTRHLDPDRRATRRPRAVRAGDRRPRPGADARRSAGDRAIVLADGSIEGFVGGQCAAGRCAPPRSARLEYGEGRAAAGAARRRATPSPSRPARASWSTPACPEARWRSTSSRCCPPPVLYLVGTSPTAEALATLAPAARLRRRARRRGRRPARRDRGRGRPATAATRPGRSGPRSTPASASSGWSASHTRGRRCSAELDLTEEERRPGPPPRRARHRRPHRRRRSRCRSWPRSCGHPARGAHAPPPAGEPAAARDRRSTRSAA